MRKQCGQAISAAVLAGLLAAVVAGLCLLWLMPAVRQNKSPATSPATISVAQRAVHEAPATALAGAPTEPLASKAVEAAGGATAAHKDASLPPGPQEKLLAGAVTLAIRETPPDAKGRITRTRLVRVGHFKYPLLRVEETVRRDPASGQEVIVSSRESVGDHVVVKVRAGAEKALAGVVAQLGGQIRRKMYRPQTYLVAFAPADLDTVPNGVVSLGKAAQVIEYVEPDYLVYALSIPNDSSFAKLWGMHNTGQVILGQPGIADADIDAPEAWDICTGSSNIVVAVIDTGIDYNHPDLAANMWKNPGEIPGNGIDDDGNGLIDDVYGYDFCNDDGDPFDDNEHGTHCAGTIGGVGNNGLGVAGVNWTVKLMALKFLNELGSGDGADAVDAIYYAISKGAKLTSNSWGGVGRVSFIADAIAEACASNQLFICAAGNGGNDGIGDDNDLVANYPSNYTNANVIAVAATDNLDELTGFSNYGLTSVDLGAPGMNIYSTTPNDTYAYFSGTSMATPNVAGACALAWAWSPEATAAEIKQAILDGTDPIASLSNKCVSGGRLNIYNTLLKLDKHVSMTPSTPVSLSGPEGGPFGPSTTYAVSNVGTNSLSWTASKTAAWLDLSLAAGTLAPGESNTIVVSANATANTLSVGTYTDTITFSNTASTFRFFRPVTLTVVDVLSVSPATGLTSIGVAGGPFTPPSQVYVVSNSASSARTWIGSVDTNWIELSSAGSTLSAQEATNVTLSINDIAKALPLGTCFATAVFSNTTSGVSQPRPVTLQMVDALSVSPGTGLVSLGSPGGPFAPSAQTFVLSNRSALVHGWTASTTVGWLTLSSTNGTLSSGATAEVTVSINSGANALLAGRYTETVMFSNTVSHNTQTRQVVLLIDVDDFAEVFDVDVGHTNDLDNMTLTFTPNGTGNFYSGCRQTATNFPTDPTGGTRLWLTLDSYTNVTLAGGAQVKLYGTNYGTFYVGSNGYITFGAGDTNYRYWQDGAMFTLPRIAGQFTHMDPGTNISGAVSWKQLADRAVVTFQNVPMYDSNISDNLFNSFQMEMFFDGRIRLTWLTLGATAGAGGLSRGGGTPVGFVQSDLTSYPAYGGFGVIPVIAGATLISESCLPTNGAIDPGETVTVNFSVKNGGTLPSTNLVVTLLTAGGVTAQSGPQTYGALIPGGVSVSRQFSFTASGICGGTIDAILQFQDGALNFGAITNTIPLGKLVTFWTQNFDGVTAPALPEGWTTSASGSQTVWVASTSAADSAPNSVFVPDPEYIGLSVLFSPTISIATPSAQLRFRHSFNFDCNTPKVGMDGGVLDIKIGNGSWLGILTAGGSFVTGGYNSQIFYAWENPLHGQVAWSSYSGGWITTIVNLPASAAGQNILLRWRCGTDKYTWTGGTGWYIDTISIAERFSPVIPPGSSLSITASVPDAAESGPVSGQFTLTRTGSTADNLAVYFAVGGTASNGVDYLPLPSLIVMAAGDSSTNITITPVDDSIVEGSETVKLTILPDVVYAIGTPSNATVTIADNVKTLTINSAHGSPVPGGIITNGSGAVLTNYVNSPVIYETNEYVCTGWTMTGNEPQSGTTNSFSMTLTNNATLTWLWTTNIVEGLPSVAFGSTNLIFVYNLPHSAPASQNFTVTNIGQNRLHISNSWNAAWLTVSPAQTNGITNGQSAVFAVSINTGNLTIGTSNAVITISSTNADNTPVTIPVQLTVQIAPVVTNRLLFDFGVSTNMTPGWNNVTNNALAVLITNAVNSTGALSGVSLRITQLFNKGYTPINGGVVASNLYPASAQADYFTAGGLLSGGIDNLPAIVRLEGLDTNQTYTLTVFGSRASGGGAGIRTGRYSVGTNSVTLDAAFNSNKVAVLSNIAPNASGQIDLVVSNTVQNTGYAYLGVLDVTWKSPTYHLLTVNGMTGGSVNPTGGIYRAGSVQISASASNYYHFVQWSGGLSGTSNPVNVTMNTNLTIQAEFAEDLLTNDVPAWWLASHGLGTNDAAAMDDPDLDGLKTWQEYIAGTDPTNGASVFKVTDQKLQSEGRVIMWNATNGRLYSVYFTTNLLTSDLWSLISETAGGSITDTIYGAADKGFYRIKVRLAP